MFSWIKSMVTHEVTHIEDDQRPFTEVLVTIAGTELSYSVVGSGRRINTDESSLEAVQKGLQELADHLLVRDGVSKVLDKMVLKAKPVEPVVEVTPADLIKDGLDACGFPTKGGADATTQPADKPVSKRP